MQTSPYRNSVCVLAVVDQLRVLRDLGLQQLLDVWRLALQREIHAEEGRHRVHLEEAVYLLEHVVDAVLGVHTEAQDVTAGLGEGLQHQRAAELGLSYSETFLRECSVAVMLQDKDCSALPGLAVVEREWKCIQSNRATKIRTYNLHIGQRYIKISCQVCMPNNANICKKK
jgi:hypothetical protein